MAVPRSRFPAYPPDLPTGLQLYLEAIRKELEGLGSQGSATIRVEESDVAVSTAANTLDFLGADFDLTESPLGEVNLAISSGISRVGHTHSAADITSGNLAYARLPTGGGTWANGGALSITGGITTVAGLTSTADIDVRTGLLKTALVGAGLYLTIVGDSGVADRGGILLNNTTTPTRHWKETATFTGSPGTSSRYRAGWVDNGDLETFLNSGAAVEIGPTHGFKFFQSGTGSAVFGVDPGASDTVRIGGTVRIGNTTTSVLASGLTLASTVASGANAQLIAGGRVDVAFYDSAAALDTKRWDISVDGVGGAGSFSFLTRNDAGTAGTQWLRALRSANVVTAVELASNSNIIAFDGTGFRVTLGSVTLGSSGARWGKLWGADADFSNTATVVQISATSTGATLNLSGQAANQRDFNLQTNGVGRWTIRAVNDAESGSNAGSSFLLVARDDAGTAIDSPLSIVRAAGGAFSWASGRPFDFGGDALFKRAGVTKLTLATSLATISTDFAIGSLGTFDSSDTPNDGELLVYHAGSVNKWQSDLISFVVGTSDFHAALLSDNTGVAYVLETLSPSDGAVNTPGTPTVTAKHLSFELKIPGSYVKTANFKRFKWETCVGASCTGWSHLIYSTSLNIVHARLTASEIRRYQVRAESASTVSSFAITGDNTVIAGSDTEAFGGIVAGNIAAVDMAALTGDFGVMKVGQMRDLFTNPTAIINFGGKGGIPSTVKRLINFENTSLPTWTDGQSMAWLNMNASASNNMLRHDKLQLNYDGSIKMTKIVVVLTSGTSWSVPADFNPFLNSIELIGGGGGGAGGVTNTRAGGGGGAGGYSKIIAFNPGSASSITYAIGAGGGGGSSGGGSGANGGQTSWNSGTVTANGGSGSTSATGAAGGSGNTFNGAQGGNGVTAGGTTGGGGGGGAGGSNSAGVAGNNGVSGTGGTGGAGGGPDGGAGGAAASTGGNGTAWTANPGGSQVGSGGGGGGGSGGGGGNGGNYGAGGGGGGSTAGSSASGGAGIAGLIVITYFPIGAL